MVNENISLQTKVRLSQMFLRGLQIYNDPFFDQIALHLVSSFVAFQEYFLQRHCSESGVGEAVYDLGFVWREIHLSGCLCIAW